MLIFHGAEKKRTRDLTLKFLLDIRELRCIVRGLILTNSFCIEQLPIQPSPPPA